MKAFALGGAVDHGRLLSGLRPSAWQGSRPRGFRVSEGFAIQPEITALINPDTGGAFLSYGVGFNFGELPVFGGD
jgi:hypothetical protein